MKFSLRNDGPVTYRLLDGPLAGKVFQKGVEYTVYPPAEKAAVRSDGTFSIVPGSDSSPADPGAKPPSPPVAPNRRPAPPAAAPAPAPVSAPEPPPEPAPQEPAQDAREPAQDAPKATPAATAAPKVRRATTPRPPKPPRRK